MRLIDFMGDNHILTGVDLDISDDVDGNQFEICLFVLDDVVYEVTENPEDSYRSFHNTPRILESGIIKNTFPGVNVIAIHHGASLLDDEDGVDDMIVFKNAETGKTILRVGTYDIDCYYPSWCCHFHPEALGEV